MRKLVANCFLSLDGVMGSPERWHLGYFNEEMQAAERKAVAHVDTVLMGRVLYQEWADFWPTQSATAIGPREREFASFVNNANKYVVSTTLRRADWSNTKLINGDVAEKITKLKQEAGGEIATWGSATLVQSLLEHRLVDEFRLMIHPVLVGSGKRLFRDEGCQRALQLIQALTFSTGVLALTYRLR